MASQRIYSVARLISYFFIHSGHKNHLKIRLFRPYFQMRTTMFPKSIRRWKVLVTNGTFHFPSFLFVNVFHMNSKGNSSEKIFVTKLALKICHYRSSKCILMLVFFVMPQSDLTKVIFFTNVTLVVSHLFVWSFAHFEFNWLGILNQAQRLRFQLRILINFCMILYPVQPQPTRI